MPDDLIQIPSFLQRSLTNAPRLSACPFCTEIACETDDMTCGCAQSGCQSVCEGSCQRCESCQTGCQISCLNCEGGCMSFCEGTCQSCEGGCQSEQTKTVRATITYNANGGAGGPGTQTVTGTTTSSSGANIWFTIPSTVPTRSGYTFAGWLFPSGYTWQPGDSTIIWATPSGTNYTATAQWAQGGAKIYIDNGTSWAEYRAYIDNGSGWDAVTPSIDNGTNWG